MFVQNLYILYLEKLKCCISSKEEEYMLVNYLMNLLPIWFCSLCSKCVLISFMKNPCCKCVLICCNLRKERQHKCFGPYGKQVHLFMPPGCGPQTLWRRRKWQDWGRRKIIIACFKIDRWTVIACLIIFVPSSEILTACCRTQKLRLLGQSLSPRGSIISLVMLRRRTREPTPNIHALLSAAHAPQNARRRRAQHWHCGVVEWQMAKQKHPPSPNRISQKIKIKRTQAHHFLSCT